MVASITNVTNNLCGRLSQSRSLGFLVWCGRTQLSLARASRSKARLVSKSTYVAVIFCIHQKPKRTNQADYTLFLQMPRSLMKILRNTFCIIREHCHFQYCEIYCKFHCLLFLVKHCNQGSITPYSCLKMVFVQILSI